MATTTVTTAMPVVNAMARAKIAAIFFVIVSPFPRQQHRHASVAAVGLPLFVLVFDLYVGAG
jgi:hypothetical protein